MSKNGWKVLFGIIPLAGDKNLTKGLREGGKEISTRNRVRSRRTSSYCRFECCYFSFPFPPIFHRTEKTNLFDLIKNQAVDVKDFGTTPDTKSTILYC